MRCFFQGDFPGVDAACKGKGRAALSGVLIQATNGGLHHGANNKAGIQCINLQILPDSVPTVKKSCRDRHRKIIRERVCPLLCSLHGEGHAICPYNDCPIEIGPEYQCS